jgi:hypothetical protein
MVHQEMSDDSLTSLLAEASCILLQQGNPFAAERCHCASALLSPSKNSSPKRQLFPSSVPTPDIYDYCERQQRQVWAIQHAVSLATVLLRRTLVHVRAGLPPGELLP